LYVQIKWWINLYYMVLLCNPSIYDNAFFEFSPLSLEIWGIFRAILYEAKWIFIIWIWLGNMCFLFPPTLPENSYNNSHYITLQLKVAINFHNFSGSPASNNQTILHKIPLQNKTFLNFFLSLKNLESFLCFKWFFL
jgi:hypothetical protein